MKAAVAVLLLGAGAMRAQEFIAPQGLEDTPIIDAPQVAPPVTTEGIVAKIFNVDRPWQLVNPLAPASYGDGRSNGTVARSEREPDKPKGFILFGIEFW